jgi:flagella basal body P-ring formation protein FlgA
MFVSISVAAKATLTEENPIIQVRSVVEVDSNHQQIVLGDLMITHGVSQKAINTLKDVRLADAPKGNESRAFTGLALEQLFKQNLRDIEVNSGEKISLRVPARVTVVRKSFRLLQEDVINALKSQFKEFCADCTFEISGLILPVIPTSIPSGATWRVSMKHALPKGNFSVPIEVTNEDMTKRSYWITGTLAVHRRVPVAARALTVGERLSPSDFQMLERDVTFATDTPVSEGELMKSLSKSPIAAGQIVWRHQLQRELAAKYGDVVKVFAGSESWEISIDGVLQSGGYIGDLVKVKIPRTQKLISGVLTESGKVEVR